MENTENTAVAIYGVDINLTPATFAIESCVSQIVHTVAQVIKEQAATIEQERQRPGRVITERKSFSPPKNMPHTTRYGVCFLLLCMVYSGKRGRSHDHR